MKAELLVREASFQTASSGQQAITSRISLFVWDAMPLEKFSAGAAAEVGPAVATLANVMDGHRKAPVAKGHGARFNLVFPREVSSP